MTLQQAMIEVGKKIPLADDQVKVRLNRAYEIVRQNGSGYTITKSVGVTTHHCSVCRQEVAICDDYCSHHPHATVESVTNYRWHVHKASTSLLEDSSSFYTVDSQGCNCPDTSRARAGLCKHRLATMLMMAMGE